MESRKEERRRLGRLHIFAMMERVRLPSVRTSSVGLLRVGFLVSLLVFRFLSLSLLLLSPPLYAPPRAVTTSSPLPLTKGEREKKKKIDLVQFFFCPFVLSAGSVVFVVSSSVQ